MYHYTYIITYQDNKQYIGARTSKCEPKDDSKYIGSSKYTPNDSINKKEILIADGVSTQYNDSDVEIGDIGSGYSDDGTTVLRPRQAQAK